jgi:TPR repeat protein
MKSIDQLLQQAKQGYLQAQNALGLLYLNGDNTARASHRKRGKVISKDLLYSR